MQAENVVVRRGGFDYQLNVHLRRTSDKLLVFMHGWGCVKEGFDAAFRFDGLGAYSICSFDFLGFGQSDKPDNFSYKLEDQAAVAADLIRSLGYGQIYLVGHSMGGGTGILMSEKLGPLLKHFISAEGNLIPEDTGDDTRRLATLPFDEFLVSGFAEFLQTLERSNTPGFATWADWCRQASPEAFYRTAQSLVAWSDNGALLPAFNALPSKSYMFGDATQKQPLTLPLIKNTQTFKISKSGHFPMLDNSQEFYTKVKLAIS